MLIVDNNPNDEPLAELTLIFGEKMQIIIRDNGKHIDLTDETVISFRKFFIYSFLEGSGTMRSYLTTKITIGTYLRLKISKKLGLSSENWS